jgi:hypothetical protein
MEGAAFDNNTVLACHMDNCFSFQMTLAVPDASARKSTHCRQWRLMNETTAIIDQRSRVKTP